MVVRDGNKGADRSVLMREIFLREKVFLRRIEGISTLTKDRDSKTTIIDMKFGAASSRGDAMILQT
jgi:hypothetical protein